MTAPVYHKYLLRLLFGTLACFLVIGMFNIIVDPYGFFNLFEIKGFNQQKEGVRNKIRYVKAIALSLYKPQTLVLGSSRIQDGVNPDHPLLQTLPPSYNLGIDMLRMHEALEFLKHAINNAPVRRIVFGLDFFMFNTAEKVNPAFDAALIGRPVRTTDLLTFPLFTKTALEDSLKTVRLSHSQPERKEFLENGYRPGQFVFYRVRDYPKLHAYTNSIFLFPSKPPATPYYGYFINGEEAFQDLKEFLIICRRENIDLKLFITPAHATLDGEGIRIAGLWNVMEDWKRRLVSITNEQNVPLWDFSGYNSITTEEVRTPMKNYWDSSHFTEAVADIILRRMLGDERSRANMPADFGTLLTPSTIEAHLRIIRARREEYAANHPAEINLIVKLYAQGQAGLQLTQQQTAGMFE